MIWGRRKRVQAEANEALAAKIEADIELAAAHETKREVTEHSEKLREINRQNHFSEGLTRSFRGRPA